MPHVLINRVPLYYEQKGQGQRQIVFIHGMGLSHTNWVEQVRSFQDRSRILTYDLRGHGRSGISPHNLDPGSYFQVLASDLKHLLDSLHIEKTILVAYSTGTLVALQFLLDYPEKAWGAVLTGAFPKVTNFYLYSKFVGSFCLSKIHRKDWLSKQVAKSNGATREHLQLFEYEARKARLKETNLMIKACLQFDISARLSSIQTPIMLVYGGNERYMMTYRHQLLTLLPQGEVCLIPHTNHACPTKGKEPFNRLLSNFMDVHEPKSLALPTLHSNQDTGNTEQYPYNFSKGNFIGNPNQADCSGRNQNHGSY